MYITAPSSSCCSRTLAATDATCSHECSHISGYFHYFTEERTMMLKVFPDDDLGSTAHDRKKEQDPHRYDTIYINASIT
ncbi:hypothetical protein BHM03_00014472 [Ensete ventricosum]|nr:hypothetical protein BHM03_00014472 [Ensete ventricosum]